MALHKFKKEKFDKRVLASKELAKALEKPNSLEGVAYRIANIENILGIETVLPEKPKK